MSDKEYDFSDASNSKINTKAMRFVVCKSGTYKAETNGKRFSLIKPELLDELNKAAGQESPCRCEICTGREKFSISKVPPGTSRSGLKRTYEAKYGEGRVLGGGEPSLKRQRQD